MESTKTRPNTRKRYLFRCFKPEDVVEAPHRKAKTKDPLLTYITLAEKQGIVLPTILSSALTAAKGGAGEGSASRRRKIEKDRSLRIRQALIAALNHTSLGKKIINRRKINKNTWGRSRINKLGGEGDSISNTEPKIPNKTNSYASSSHCSPAFTPSLSCSTCSSNSQSTQISVSSSEPRSLAMSGSRDTKQNQDVGDGESRKGCFGSNMAVYLLFLTSLLVLILWGKFCAILCTSIGFFVVPLRRRSRNDEEGISGESTEFDSVQYKKKIVMEGLLGRRKF